MLIFIFGRRYTRRQGKERAESRLAEAEKKGLEAKLKAKRESERLEDRAILSSASGRCEIKDKYVQEKI